MKRRTFIRCLGCGAALAVAPGGELLPEFLGGVQNAVAFDYAQKLS